MIVESDKLGEAAQCESGGIGRRTRLRIWRGNPWGFESPLSHQFFQFPAFMIADSARRAFLFSNVVAADLPQILNSLYGFLMDLVMNWL